MRSTKVSRRTATQALIASALLAAAPFSFMRGHGALQSPIPAPFGEVLAQFRRRVIAPFSVDELFELLAAGRELASATAVNDDATIAQLIGGELDVLTSLSEAEVRSRIEQNIRADFAAEHTVTVGGWILSRTELLMVSLAGRPDVQRARVPQESS
jgi:hypothetical protein